VSLWFSAALAATVDGATDHLAQARQILEYYLSDNTPDLQFRRALDPAQAETALALVEKHLALHTRDDVARGWSALAYLALGRPDEALPEIEAALDGGLAGAAWLNLAGDVEYARGDLSAALDFYSRAALLKKNPWHQWDVARVLSEIGADGSAAAWDKLVADYPNSASAWLEHGWHAYEARDYAKAQASYEKAITIKDSAEAHNRLGILFNATGNGAQAEAEYRKAIAVEPSPQLYANLIDLMLNRNANATELEPVYGQLLAQYPDEPYAQRVNGDRLRAAGNPQAALEAYKRAGEDAYTLNAIGNCLYDLKRYDEAAASYQRSLEATYDAVVLGNLAGALRAGGKTDAERALWEKHVALHGDDGRVRQGYGNALFNAGRFAEALEQYRRAKQYGADNADLHNQSGLALLETGKPAEAAAEFQAAAALDGQAVYFSNAGYALGLAGQWSEAEAVYRSALDKFPGDADLTSGLGEALAAQGRSSQAASEVLAAAETADATAGPVGTGVSLSAVGTPVRASAQEPTVEEVASVTAEPDLQPGEVVLEDSVAIDQESGKSDSEDESVANYEAEPLKQAAPTTDSLTAVPTADALTGVPTETLPVPAPETTTDLATQARLYTEAARHAADAGNIEQALDAYRRSFAAQPDLDVAADLALLLARQNRGTQLVEFVAEVKAALGPPAADKLVDRLGRHYLEGKDFAGGMALMQRLIEADPAGAVAYNQLALLQAAQRDPHSALATVKRGLNDAGDNYIGRYLEASFTAAVSGPTAALPLARDVTLLPEAERNGYMLYLKLLEQHGNYSEASSVSKTAFEKNPTNPQLLGYYARALYFSGDPAAAVALLEDPAKAKLDYPARYEILGQSYLDLGNYAKAEGYLTKALALRPDEPELLAALGQAQLFLWQSNEARTTLGRALNIEPTLASARLWQGWLQARADDSAAARVNFDAVEADPLSDKEELAWSALGRAVAALNEGDRESAKVQADKAAAFNVQSDAFYAELDAVRKLL
jgi:tetratricopeptide (TPR) repeat protein